MAATPPAPPRQARCNGASATAWMALGVTLAHGFLSELDLHGQVAVVCTAWRDAAATAQLRLLPAGPSALVMASRFGDAMRASYTMGAVLADGDFVGRVARVKRRIDSECDPVDGWRRLGLGSADAQQGMLAAFARDAEPALRQLLPAMPVSRMPPHKFRREFVDAGLDAQPMLLRGALCGPGAGAWPALAAWQPSALLRGPHASVPFRVGEDWETGDDVCMQLADVLAYASSTTDDTPLYVFDHHFGERAPSMLAEYSGLREYLPDDLMSALPARPPFQWLLVGAAGSGTEVHRDPPGTVAWNAVVSGVKLWAMLPPDVSPEEAGDDIVGDDEPPLVWFSRHLPGVLAKRGLSTATLAIQHPGDVVCVPPGWWHAVWNLTPTVAITENIVTWPMFLAEWAGLMAAADAATLTAAAMCDLVTDRFGLVNTRQTTQWLGGVLTYATDNGLDPPAGLVECVAGPDDAQLGS